MVQDQALARRLLETVPLIMRFIDKGLRETCLHVEANQYQILGMLTRRNFTVSELAQKQKVSLPSMSKTVNALVERGWVERIDVPGDRRVVQLRISEPGRGALAGAHDEMVERVAQTLSQLRDDERETLSDGLDVLHVAFGGPLIRPDEWGHVSPAHHEPAGNQIK
jgi:DNA-binding MarR family transcriptional regulator